MTEQKLGFGTTLRPKRIFISKEETSLWHFWNTELQQKEPITNAALTGYITGIKKLEVTSDYGDTVKLLISIKADTNYEIQVGFSTWFAKTLLLNLNTLDSKELQKVLTIEPFSNTTSKVVLCNLYLKEQRVVSTHEWKRDAKGKVIDDLNLDQLFTQVVEKIGMSATTDETLIHFAEETVIEELPSGFSDNSLEAVVF